MKHTNKAGLLAALQLAIDALLDRASDYLDDDDGRFPWVRPQRRRGRRQVKLRPWNGWGC